MNRIVNITIALMLLSPFHAQASYIYELTFSGIWSKTAGVAVAGDPFSSTSIWESPDDPYYGYKMISLDFSTFPDLAVFDSGHPDTFVGFETSPRFSLGTDCHGNPWPGLILTYKLEVYAGGLGLVCDSSPTDRVYTTAANYQYSLVDISQPNVSSFSRTLGVDTTDTVNAVAPEPRMLPLLLILAAMLWPFWFPGIIYALWESAVCCFCKLKGVMYP